MLNLKGFLTLQCQNVPEIFVFLHMVGKASLLPKLFKPAELPENLVAFSELVGIRVIYERAL